MVSLNNKVVGFTTFKSTTWISWIFRRNYSQCILSIPNLKLFVVAIKCDGGREWNNLFPGSSIINICNSIRQMNQKFIRMTNASRCFEKVAPILFYSSSFLFLLKNKFSNVWRLNEAQFTHSQIVTSTTWILRLSQIMCTSQRCLTFIRCGHLCLYRREKQEDWFLLNELPLNSLV